MWRTTPRVGFLAGPPPLAARLRRTVQRPAAPDHRSHLPDHRRWSAPGDHPWVGDPLDPGPDLPARHRPAAAPSGGSGVMAGLANVGRSGGGAHARAGGRGASARRRCQRRPGPADGRYQRAGAGHGAGPGDRRGLGGPDRPGRRPCPPGRRAGDGRRPGIGHRDRDGRAGRGLRRRRRGGRARGPRRHRRPGQQRRHRHADGQSPVPHRATTVPRCQPGGVRRPDGHQRDRLLPRRPRGRARHGRCRARHRGERQHQRGDDAPPRVRPLRPVPSRHRRDVARDGRRPGRHRRGRPPAAARWGHCHRHDP